MKTIFYLTAATLVPILGLLILDVTTRDENQFPHATSPSFTQFTCAKCGHTQIFPAN